jgi:hypothetical protein
MPPCGSSLASCRRSAACRRRSGCSGPECAAPRCAAPRPSPARGIVLRRDEPGASSSADDASSRCGATLALEGRFACHRSGGPAAVRRRCCGADARGRRRRGSCRWRPREPGTRRGRHRAGDPRRGARHPRSAWRGLRTARHRAAQAGRPLLVASATQRRAGGVVPRARRQRGRRRAGRGSRCRGRCRTWPRSTRPTASRPKASRCWSGRWRSARGVSARTTPMSRPWSSTSARPCGSPDAMAKPCRC